MSLFRILFIFYIFISILCTITSPLPVTSKPIENTPEHLAWEAWIMVPSSHEKTRKITPKSIFIVPNGTKGNDNGINSYGSNSGNGNKGSPSFMPQIQCPPGHTIDNFKCIPTVNIDQSQILITRLTNLVHSTDKYNSTLNNPNDSYDYDYEYDTFDTDETQSFPESALNKIQSTLNIDNKNQLNNYSPSATSAVSGSDYIEQPLKINLSLGKFPLINEDEKKSENNSNKKPEDITSVESDETSDTNDDKKSKNHIKILQPFHGKESSSPTTTILPSTTPKPKTNKNNDNTNKDSSTRTKTSIDTKSAPGTTATTTTKSTTTPTRTITSTSSSKTNTTMSNKLTSIHSTVTQTNSPTNPIPLLSPSESEMQNDDSNSKNTKDSQDYELEDQSTSRTTTNDEMEFVTNSHNDETKSNNFKDEMKKESLIPEDDKTTTTAAATTNIDFTDTTDTEEQYPATTPLGDNESQTDTILPTDDSKKTTTSITKPSEKSTTNSYKNKITKHDHLLSTKESIEGHNKNTAPFMESIESNNRFIYHHLGSSIGNQQDDTHATPTSSSTTTKTTTLSPEVREQLRIINKIVEENKRRMQKLQQQQQKQQQQQQQQQQKQTTSSQRLRFPSTEDNESYNPHYNHNFPTSHHHNHHQQQQQPNNRFDNIRSEFVRFPSDTTNSFNNPTQIHTPNQYKPPSPTDSIYSPDRRFYPSPPSPYPSVITPNNAGIDNQQNTKPYWWLPTGWEVDRTADRPMFVRFWSRIPAEPTPFGDISISSSNNNLNRYGHLPSTTSSIVVPTATVSTTTTTSRYRENSRSPTENLYRQEVSSDSTQRQQQSQQYQDIYRVLGAKHQWKHNNR